MTQVEPLKKEPSKVSVSTQDEKIPSAPFFESKIQWSRSTPADGELFKQEFDNIYKNIKDHLDFLNQLTLFFLDENVGQISAFVSHDWIPDHWLFCDGKILLKSQFPKLFASLRGITWANETLFRIPDLRGYFLRGHNPNGENNPDFPRSLKDTQRHGMLQHTHDFSVSSEPHQIGEDSLELRNVPDEYKYSGEGRSFERIDTSSPQYKFGPLGAFSTDVYAVKLRDFVSKKLRHSHGVKGATTIQQHAATETRPDNKAVVFCIRADASAGVMYGGGALKEEITPQSGSTEKYTST